MRAWVRALHPTPRAAACADAAPPAARTRALRRTQVIASHTSIASCRTVVAVEQCNERARRVLGKATDNRDRVLLQYTHQHHIVTSPRHRVTLHHRGPPTNGMRESDAQSICASVSWVTRARYDAPAADVENTASHTPSLESWLLYAVPRPDAESVGSGASAAVAGLSSASVS
jgi:hypothetical protein